MIRNMLYIIQQSLKTKIIKTKNLLMIILFHFLFCSKHSEDEEQENRDTMLITFILGSHSIQWITRFINWRMKYMKEGKIHEIARPWLKGNLYKWTLTVASEVFLPANVSLAIDNHWHHPESFPITALSRLPEPLQNQLPKPRELPPNQLFFFFSY